MSNTLAITFSSIAGLGLGVLFYGGLYLTVTRGLSSQHPALWFFTSFVLRTAVVLTGFYFINDGHWPRLVSCLAGFIIIRFAFPLWKKMPLTSDKPLKPTYVANNSDGAHGSKHHAP